MLGIEIGQPYVRNRPDDSLKRRGVSVIGLDLHIGLVDRQPMRTVCSNGINTMHDTTVDVIIPGAERFLIGSPKELNTVILTTVSSVFSLFQVLFFRPWHIIHPSKIQIKNNRCLPYYRLCNALLLCLTKGSDRMDLLKEALTIYPKLTTEERELIHALIKGTSCNQQRASASPQAAEKDPSQMPPAPDR